MKMTELAGWSLQAEQQVAAAMVMLFVELGRPWMMKTNHRGVNFDTNLLTARGDWDWRNWNLGIEAQQEDGTERRVLSK